MASESSLQAEVNRLRLQVEHLQVKDGSEPVYIGQYLLTRLEQLKVTKMFGVPGDFNLGFLDLVEDHPTIDWVGNCNELNASYAADGYARVKEHSLGVVLTTFGVGELSATNGIAGAFSEMVPVLHIAGVPSMAQQKTKPMLHHTLGDGRYDAYIKAAENFSISQAILTSKENAAAEIDRVLTDCITRARPVYLTLPTNLVYEKISSARLKIPLSRLPPPNDPDVQTFVIDEIVKLVQEADDDVVVLVDACAIRHDVREEVNELIKKTGFPVYSAPMGKTSVSENYERYGGIYVGSISHPEIKEKVESAKLILSIGCLKSDFNTGNFTYSIPTPRTVEFHSDHTKVQFAAFGGIGMKELLPQLTSRLQPAKRQVAVPPFTAVLPQENNDIISQAWFWPRMGQFFKPKDVILAETGTSSFGILDVPLPENSVFLAQILWGSIGWTTGATLGAAFAAQDVGLGRTILFIGDGSLQLTVQELSSMIRHGLKPIIFVLNNDGYTIERFLHGKERKYNDIAPWKWTGLLGVLGDADGTKSKSYTVHNKAELSALLDNNEFAAADKIQLVEVMMPRLDAPSALERQAELSGKTNAYVAA
ncbi:Pyruvate decarboxylase [Mycena indigotica]|uniref:Pyruvate decarboxylase n=1 Tax=Mycena indigotica TaxID=2126181 RepID=A0A8H6SGC1_9AGAR|nr:Pyruvate decarboxylase [Mycena indigotica]KAF7299075.1 Pyruvate decarboxylase [Mycena indigotica]